MGEYAGFLVILAFSGCAYGKHLKFAKAHEYWGFGLLRCARNDGKKLLANEKLAVREGLTRYAPRPCATCVACGRT